MRTAPLATRNVAVLSIATTGYAGVVLSAGRAAALGEFGPNVQVAAAIYVLVSVATMGAITMSQRARDGVIQLYTRLAREGAEEELMMLAIPIILGVAFIVSATRILR